MPIWKRLWMLAYFALLVLGILSWTYLVAHAHWKPEYAQADPGVQAWYRNAQLTPEAAARLGWTSCCAHSDVVKTHFRVNKKDGGDEWWWFDDQAKPEPKWKRVPPDIIHWGESAPDGQPTLFAVGETETCFYPGESGN